MMVAGMEGFFDKANMAVLSGISSVLDWSTHCSNAWRDALHKLDLWYVPIVDDSPFPPTRTGLNDCALVVVEFLQRIGNLVDSRGINQRRLR